MKRSPVPEAPMGGSPPPLVYVPKSGMKQVIEAKVEDREIVRPEGGDEPQVVNLMDALRRSVSQVKRPAADERPARKMAPSKAKASAARKTRRKTG